MLPPLQPGQRRLFVIVLTTFYNPPAVQAMSFRTKYQFRKALARIKAGILSESLANVKTFCLAYTPTDIPAPAEVPADDPPTRAFDPTDDDLPYDL